MGMDYGAAVISEGVFHALSDEEIRKSGIHFTYDEHGHPELGKVSKAHIFNEMIEMKLKELGLKVKSGADLHPCRPGAHPLPLHHQLRQL